MNGFDSFTVVQLRRPADAPDLPDAELERLQGEHVAFMESLREAGSLLANGPYRDQEDVSLRGLCIYGVGLEEARALAAKDPLVRAGRLAADSLTWLVPAGLLSFGP